MPDTRAPAHLVAAMNGPYTDNATNDAAALATETIRYLNYATRAGGITDPATVATMTANLADAAYRLPQLLTQTGDWCWAPKPPPAASPTTTTAKPGSSPTPPAPSSAKPPSTPPHSPAPSPPRRTSPPHSTPPNPQANPAA